MEQTERLIHFFKENNNALAQISVAELRDVVSLSMAVVEGEEYLVELKRDAFFLLSNIAAIDRLSIKERWAIYYYLIRKMFVSMEYDEYDRLMDQVYARIYLDVEKRMPEGLLEAEANMEQEGPVVIMTSQFLSIAHAPTRRVLDYAYTLKTMFGVPVKIINDASTHYKVDYPYMVRPFDFNYIEEFSQKHKIAYKDKDFDFYQVSCEMPDLQEIANLVYNIKQISPRLVLNVGGSCLTSDLCRRFVKTATIPCSTSFPRTMAESLVVCRELRESDQGKMDALYPWQKVVTATFNYVMPDDTNLNKYTREEFRIPEDAWLLASAGNRLGLELDEGFMRMVDGILGDFPDAYFLIVGRMDEGDRERITEGLSHADRICFAGVLADGSQAIRLADVYIQPTRKGGGRAAFEALYYGVPVITTSYGDTWDVCGGEFAVASYEEMAERIREYHDNSEAYGKAKEAGMARAAVLEDMEGMLAKLLQDLEVDFQTGGGVVDPSKFHPVFDWGKEYALLELKDEMKGELQEKFGQLDGQLQGKLGQLLNIAYTSERRLRDNEWATVFHDTVRPDGWLKDVPLSPGRVALDYPGLYALYRSLDEFRPKNILELGLGQSTRVIDAYSGHFGARHTIVEHDKSWVEFFLGRHGKNEDTRILCPERLEEPYHGRYIDTQSPIKHYKDFASELAGEVFDFIFIDGPQGSDECSRVDVTELLPECLASSFVIMLDDSNREGENRTLGVIAQILQNVGIAFKIGAYDGLKDTALIVSEDLKFLLSL